MSRSTKWRVFLSCVGFLAFIYAIASLDPGQRKQAQVEISAMAEKQESENVAETKTMYLTFDDGPSKNTQAVLDILDQYDIKATFFVTGENPEYASMIKTIYERGHRLGMHTYSHKYSALYASVDDYFKDLAQIHDLIQTQTGEDVRILRFPGGSSNTISKNYGNGIMSTLVKEVEAKGYQYYDWNAHNGDGDPGLSADTLNARALKDIKGKSEVMMLLHDGSGNANTVKSLDALLKELIKQGWTFKTIDSQGMSVFHHHVAN